MKASFILHRLFAILLALSLGATGLHCAHTGTAVPQSLNGPNTREASTDPAPHRPYAWRLEAMPRDGMPANYRSCRNPFLAYDANEITRRLEDPTHVTSREGLDALNASGSAAFSDGELSQLVRHIRETHDGPIAIVDLRSETHGFLNGAQVSHYGRNNWGNIGKNTAQVLADERATIHGTLGNTIAWGPLSSKNDYQPVHTEDVLIATARTEEEQCAAEQVGYKRIAVLDHTFPTDEAIDEFIEFYRGLAPNTWLHFHCKAGKGRTTLFMAFYDMMRNPGVSLQDIAYRQCLIGGKYVLYDGYNDPGWKQELYREKAALVPVFYQYVQENAATGYATPYSEWKRGVRR